MENNYKIIELTKDTDDKFWQMRVDYILANKKPHEDAYKDIVTYQKRVEEIKAEKESYSSSIVLVNDQIVASIVVQVSPDNNKNDEIYLSITLPSTELDTNLLKSALSYTRKRITDDYPVTIAINSLLTPEIRSDFKLKVKTDVDVCLLKRKNLNYALLKEWQQSAEKTNPDLRLEMFTELPESLIDEYSALFTRLLNDMPQPEVPTLYNITGDDTRKGQLANLKDENIIYRLLAFNQENVIVAKSNVRIVKKVAEYPYQFMTGVDAKYRGRGIGSWFKSIMYPMIFEKHPEVKGIISEMRPENKYIQDINALIGYEKIGERGEYVMNKEDFTEWRKNEIL